MSIVISPDDLSQWQDLLRRLEEGGNDGADVYEAQEFLKAMCEKYGETAVKECFI